ncbi:MAG: sigma 54-interacting transcriptional regulator [Tissierellaceae bacterium]|nr:sigma 54-interacting transcriptional regulator [Tissierellaceae bacterium]
MARRIKIVTNVDTPHLTYKFLTILSRNNISILNMEVYSKIAYYVVPDIEDDIWNKAINDMNNLEEFESVEEVALLPFEERDIEMKRVLDIIPQGVVVLNPQGHIKYGNDLVTEKIFKTTLDNITDKLITHYITDENVRLFILNDEKSKSIKNQKIQIGNQFYNMNIKPIVGDGNVFSGYLLSLSDIVNQDIYHNPITFEDIIGESNKMYEVVNQAKLYAKSDSPVLITGESGTGKELFARAIHNLSDRKLKPFIAINCAAIPEQLLESELFGYERGSFTGGKKEGSKGIFEIGEGGTIFLDEIGEMPPHLQSKLLRVLQEKSVRRIGGHQEIPIDIRIISATNQDIDNLVNTGKFRLDLLYRINIFNVEIPSLRNRKDDIPILVEHFTTKHSKRYGKVINEIDTKAMKKMVEYNWPGNIRELQNVVERAVALSANNIVEEKDIILNLNIEMHRDIPDNSSLTDVVGEFERDIILKALKNNNSVRSTAKKLKVTPTLLTNRIKRYNILDKEWRK